MDAIKYDQQPNLRQRTTHFFQGVPDAPQVNDSRFGLRTLPKSDEKPSIISYASAGRGPNGESQS